MDQASQIKEKIDIVSLISEYVPLKKAGSNFKGLCPFHTEKTSSFVVSSERQIWHCFGCGKGGDCFTFLMDYERLEFPEVLRLLAKRAGVELLQDAFFATGSTKEKIYAINRLTSEFYHYVLLNHPAGKKALAYLQERGVTPALMVTFMIGFAPKDGTSLSSYLLNKKKYKREDIIEAGIAMGKGPRVVDFFIDRIMFPLFDHRDNIVGFSGRTLVDSANSPKYINTRETAVYHKGSHFFGIHLAKEEIKKSQKAILVEGEFDVIACYKSGIKNAIAAKGTAFTDNQALLLARFTKNVTLCFDKDSAGKEALKRSVPVLERNGLTSTVITLNGKDPDEALQADPFAMKKALKDEVNVYDYLLSAAVDSSNPSVAQGKKEISDELIPLYGAIANEIVKEHFLKKLSKILDVSYEAILKEVEKKQKKEKGKESSFLPKQKTSKKEIVQEYLCALILQAEEPTIILNRALEVVALYMWEIPSFQKLMTHMEEFLKTKKRFDRQIFLKGLPKELHEAFDTCILFPIPEFENLEKYIREVDTTAKSLKDEYFKSKMQHVSEDLKKAEVSGDTQKLDELQKEFARLVSSFHKGPS